MKYSETEIAARKQVAMAACNFFVSKGYPHVTVSLTDVRIEMTLYVDLKSDVIRAKKQSNSFMLDGTSRSCGKGMTQGGDTFYYLTLQWLD